MRQHNRVSSTDLVPVQTASPQNECHDEGFGVGGQQLRDALVEGEQLHAGTHGSGRQVAVSHLAVADHAANATGENFGEIEVQCQQPVRRPRRVVRQQISQLSQGVPMLGQCRLAHHADELRLGDGASRPARPCLPGETAGHGVVELVVFPKQRDQGVDVQQVRDHGWASVQCVDHVLDLMSRHLGRARCDGNHPQLAPYSLASTVAHWRGGSAPTPPGPAAARSHTQSSGPARPRRRPA